MKILNKPCLFFCLFLISGCTDSNEKKKIVENLEETSKIEKNRTIQREEKYNSSMFFSEKFPNTKPIAVIQNVEPYQNLTVPFSLLKDTKVFIHAIGEGMNCMDVKSSGESDHIEFFFDMLNEKRMRYDENDRQYRFFWNWNKVEGNNFSTRGLKVKQSQSQKIYTIELKFPWKTLGFVNPKEDLVFGFDFTITDKDLNDKIKYSWFTINDQNWENPNLFGNMKLSMEEPLQFNKDSVFVSKFTKVPPQIDSKNEAVWDKAIDYKTTKVISEFRPKTVPFNATIKSLWDKDFLYFFVEVWDEQRYKPACDYLIWDFTYIETPDGKVVWEMLPEKTKHAGGALKNLQCDTTFYIKKGDYLLKYVSDENHAYNNWNDDPPSEPFYGVYLSETP